MLVNVGEEPDPDVLPGVPGPGGDPDQVPVVAPWGGHALQAVGPVHADVLALRKKKYCSLLFIWETRNLGPIF